MPIAVAEEAFAKDRLALMLDHFGQVPDPRDPAKVRFPLREVLFLVVCASIASCDDYEEIAAWGERHLDFLRRHAEYHFGTPGEDWLRALMNRIDPALFEAVFAGFVGDLLGQDAPGFVAFDGKTLRRSGEVGAGQRPLHLVSAWASGQRLVLAQEAVGEKRNECAAIFALLGRMRLAGALVTINAIATTPKMAEAITGAGADYLLAVKRNQPSLHAEAQAYFEGPEGAALPAHETVEKDHGRIETRTARVTHDVSWLVPDRAAPHEPRFPKLACLVASTTRTERKDGRVTEQTRYFLSSRRLSAKDAAYAVRSHWGIESLHWSLDVTFREDQSRLRRGHGAPNMALVRRLAFNLVRSAKGKRSIKSTRKAAGWDTDTLERILTQKPR